MVYFSSYKMGRNIHRSHTIFETIDEKMNTFNKFLAFVIFAGAFAAVFEEKDASVRKLYGDFEDKSTLVASVPLSEADKRDILDQHNKLRRNVANGLERRGDPGPQPPASNMRKMRWDNDLAMAAQKYSDQCTDSLYDITFLAGPWKDDYARYGGGVSSYYDGWWKELFLASYNESVSWYSYQMGPFFPFEAALYYNVISAVTYAVGCGVSKCDDGYSNIMFACLYSPREGFDIYKVGKAASKCPSGTYANNSLCV